MANYSTFQLKLSGHPFKLKEAHIKLLLLTKEFNISEITYEEFTHEPPTWYLQGEARWGVNMEKLLEFLSPFELSGFVVDAEPGSDFFIKITMENGIETNTIDTKYMSDEHYEYCPDNAYWYEHLSYALEGPDYCGEEIEFMLKHNIITREYLKSCQNTQKNK